MQTIAIETFSFDEFKKRYERIFPESEEWKLKEHLQFLFDNSIVGQKKQGRWEYVCSLPNLKMNIENEFRTHHALKYRLQLLESRPNQSSQEDD